MCVLWLRWCVLSFAERGEGARACVFCAVCWCSNAQSRHCCLHTLFQAAHRQLMATTRVPRPLPCLSCESDDTSSPNGLLTTAQCWMACLLSCMRYVAYVCRRWLHPPCLQPCGGGCTLQELRATHNRVLFIVMYHACGILVALCRMVLSYVEGKHVNATEAEV